MSRYIPEDIIREIKDRADIHEVISSYIPLKNNGTHRWKALCPFHQEKTPSFVVSSERQSYHCFGCGKGGNVFTFIMEKESVDFVNAAHLLASRYGIIIPETPNTTRTPEDKKRANLRERLYTLHQKLSLDYSKILFSDKDSAGLNYLRTRGIPEDIIKSFMLGFAPESWDFAIKEAKLEGYTEEELIVSGIVVNKSESDSIYDRFRSRIMFPIWNEQGKVIAFSGRTIDPNPTGGKYVNSPETPIFKKGNILYALPISREGIRKHKFAILCEGQIDVIAMHRAGYNNAVAPQGTAFTEDQARLLKRYTNKVFICFDGDTAGIKATFKALEVLLSNDIEVKIITLPTGSDPDTILQNNGKEALVEYVSNARDFLDFMIDTLSKTYDLSSPFDKNRLLHEILTTVSKISNNIIRTTYTSLLAKRLSLSEKAVLAELNNFNKHNYYKKKTPTKQTVPNEQTIKTYMDPAVEHAEKELLELSILHSTVGRRLEEELPIEMISNTPIGKALNLAISLTLNEEWENISNELSLLLNDYPDSILSGILSNPTKLSENYDFDKSVTDCIKKIISCKLTEEIHTLMSLVKNAQNIEEKREMTKKITLLRKEIIQLKHS
jgi:DNA primase